MRAATLGELFSSPHFILIFLALLTCVANIIVGVNILPRDKREKGYKLHKHIFHLVIIWYASFLILNHYLLSGNGFWEYFTLFYLLVIIPWSRKINVTLHAIITSLGAILLVGIITFRLL